MFKISILALLIIQGSVAPPVTKNKAETEEKDGNETGLEDYMEYHRYLKEVVDTLESDPQFREKLEKAKESDIRSGKIAHELEFVSHKVRSRLDELKRYELERLRHLATKQYEIENGLNTSQGKVGALHADKQHLDHVNPHTFEIEDLKKLIAKSTQDLAEADKKRREEFKEYEMQKEFEKQEKLKSLDESHRAELEKQLQKQEEQHKKHAPLHHPGSKQQLEEVWEKQDHMEQQDFDPKTFFMLHDLDGNGAWDENEVKTLFIRELDKMYNEGAPEDDMRERIEEMERMREHVFTEVDKNKDGFISYQEFLDQTKKQDFQEDKGWEGLDQNKQYTEEEYRLFEKRRLEEVERLISQGMFPPQGHQPGQVPPGYQPQYHPQGQMPPQYGQMPPQYGQMPPQAQQMHPQGQMPPQRQMYPQGGHPQGQVPQPGQYQPGQVPQQQFNPGKQQPQVPQQQAPPQQLNNNQVDSNQVPGQGNPAGQGQLPQLNTNEVYVNQGQAQQSELPIPKNDHLAQKNVVSADSPQVNKI